MHDAGKGRGGISTRIALTPRICGTDGWRDHQQWVACPWAGGIGAGEMQPPACSSIFLHLLVPPLLPAAPAAAESPAHALQGRQALSSSSNTSCTLPPSGSGTGAFPCSAAPSCSRREESTSCTAARRGGEGGHGSLDCSCRSKTGRAIAERLLRDGESWPLASPTKSSASTGV